MDRNKQVNPQEFESAVSRDSASQYTDDFSSSYQNYHQNSHQKVTSGSAILPSSSNNLGNDEIKSRPTNSNPKEDLFQSHPIRDNITLMPVKVKDMMELFQNNSEYKDKSPVMINMKEHDIDKVIQQQGYGYSPKPSISPVKFPHQENIVYRIEQGSPMFVGQPITKQSRKDKPPKIKKSSRQKIRSFDEEELISQSENTSYSFTELDQSRRDINNPYSAISGDQHVYIMPETEFTAYPMVGSEGYQKRGRTRKRRSKPDFFRSLSRRRKPQSRSGSKFGVYRSKPYRSRSRPMLRKRPRSRIPRKRGRIPFRSTTPIRRVAKSPCARVCLQNNNTCCGVAPVACTRFPLCDNECTFYGSNRLPRTMTSSRGQLVGNYAPQTVTGNLVGWHGLETRRNRQVHSPGRRVLSPRGGPRVVDSRPRVAVSRPVVHRQSAVNIMCHCKLCQDKIQFIQPGVCSKKQNMWVNEYAVIPKQEVTLIDPCRDLDPRIYPRADRPCLRDSHGNPLTDCIGRPLRDPIGKRFLRFTANGSVLDTSFRGNFYTGQPPLCVKCPLPTNTCAPDTTHNWWMSCGYPIKPNMAPFYNNLVAAEHRQKNYMMP